MVYYFGDGHSDALNTTNTIRSPSNTTKVSAPAPMWGATMQPIMDTMIACRVSGSRVFLNGPKSGQGQPFAQVTLELLSKKALKEVSIDIIAIEESCARTFIHCCN